MSEVVDQAVKALPFAVRAQVLDELAYEHARGYARNVGPFMSYVGPLITGADPKNAVESSINRAAINELDPDRFPEIRGQWPVMRARLVDAVRAVSEVAKRRVFAAPHEPGYLVGMDDLRAVGVGPIIEAVTQAYGDVVWSRTGQLSGVSDLAQWERKRKWWLSRYALSGVSDLAQWEAIATAITALAPTAFQLYQQRLQLAQLQKQRQAAEQQAAAARQQFQQSIAAPQAAPPPVPTAPRPPTGGIPWYFIVAGLVAALGIGYAVVRKSTR